MHRKIEKIFKSNVMKTFIPDHENKFSLPNKMIKAQNFSFSLFSAFGQCYRGIFDSAWWIRQLFVLLAQGSHCKMNFPPHYVRLSYVVIFSWILILITTIIIRVITVNIIVIIFNDKIYTNAHLILFYIGAKMYKIC